MRKGEADEKNERLMRIKGGLLVDCCFDYVLVFR